MKTQNPYLSPPSLPRRFPLLAIACASFLRKASVVHSSSPYRVLLFALLLLMCMRYCCAVDAAATR
ncbi:hypothetical protein BVRB_8g202070 [Beta vulgaris subsp. vulgaris]|uniref:Uncharacterized protein n=1 Tax=Beta vulgaris subsp. vulgaris TaxID=3555 RepID=A0A0J8B9M0_BETVV|nr:hypothetical protein BVRB_8g202070 [Beta vulgaris subsp. vulgaris]